MCAEVVGRRDEGRAGDVSTKRDESDAKRDRKRRGISVKWWGNGV